MADSSLDGVLSFLLIVIIVGAGMIALALVCYAVLPRFIERTRATAIAMPVRSFGVGLINIAFFGLIAAAFAAGGPGARLVALLVTIALSVPLTLGLAAVALAIGERLRPGDPRVLWRLALGVLALTLAALVPLVGWLLVPLVAGCTGVGATAIELVRRPAHRGSASGAVSPASPQPPQRSQP
jgi:hypothetical protein